MFEEMLQNPTSVILVLSGATTGLVEVMKATKLVNKKYLPLISLLAGIFISWCIADFAFSSTVLVLGVVFGLSASGFFSNVKSFVEFATTRKSITKR